MKLDFGILRIGTFLFFLFFFTVISAQKDELSGLYYAYRGYIVLEFFEGDSVTAEVGPSMARYQKRGHYVLHGDSILIHYEAPNEYERTKILRCEQCLFWS